MAKKSINAGLAGASLALVYQRGSDGFQVSEPFRKELKRRGLCCPVCNSWRADQREAALTKVDQIVLDHMPKYVTAMMIGGLGGFGIHHDLLRELKIDPDDKRFVKRPLVLENGRVIPEYLYLAEKRQRTVLRGTTASWEGWINVCHECGRLMYWPMPVAERYLLKAYWTGHEPAGLLYHDIIATPERAVEIVGKFPRLRAERLLLQETPRDELPIDYDELVAEVKRRGWYTKL